MNIEAKRWASNFQCANLLRTDLDELWSFVCKKANKRWIWIALCRATRQVVAYVTGDRSQSSCQQMWQPIPAAYRAGHCYSDFWEAYQAVISEEQHTAAGKETGLTAHVERWKATGAPLHPLAAHQLSVLVINRHPELARCRRFTHQRTQCRFKVSGRQAFNK